MTAESPFRAAFWILFAGVLAMRTYFALKVRRAGERIMPDHEAVEREGRGMFAFRVVMFLTIARLAGALCHRSDLDGSALGSISRLAALGGVCLGPRQSCILVVDSSCAWQGMVTPAAIAEGTSPGDHRALRPDTPPTLHRHDRLWNRPCISDSKLFFCSLCNGSNCELI